MKDDRLLDDSDLRAAFRSVRETYDGTREDSNITLQRALFKTRTRERRHRVTRWVVLPIAAVLAASTAWAGVTGKLAPAVQSVLESFHSEHAPKDPSVAAGGPARATHASEASGASEPAPPEPASQVEPAPQAEPAAEPVAPPPSLEPAPVATAPVVVAPKTPAPSVTHVAAPSPASSDLEGSHRAHAALPPSEPPAAPSASANDPNAALFAEAHRLHFIERDPARALAAWDRYLAAAPNGRFAPEARYNRALALVRLGRPAEAKSELEAFAHGTYGNYRRDEAKALLDALTRDAAP
jgi:hypothetical protein